MDFQVYLINANLSYSKAFSAQDNQGLIAIHNGLKSEGIDSILLPDETIDAESQIKAFLSGGNVLENEVINRIDNNGLKIIGLSAWTQAYSFLENIAGNLRKKLNNAYIVAGGPHFTVYEETKKDFLKSPLDAYALGGSPFVEFCTGVRDGEIELCGKEIKGDVPKGFYYISNGAVAGRGRGTFPRIDIDKIGYVPYRKIRLDDDDVERIVVYLPSSNVCLNGCKYCSSPKNSADAEFLAEYINSVLRAPELHGENFYVSFTGNNPFMKENRQDTEYLLSTVAETGENAECGFFLDPSLLIGKEYGYMEDVLLKYDIPLSFFIGRDRVKENDARRWRGVKRTQERLDSEMEGMVDFMKAAGRKKEKGRFAVSYIAFPEDDAQAYKNTAAEMIRLALLGKITSVDLRFQANILTPFPGTPLREKNMDRIDESVPWGLYSISRNCWKDAPLLDHMQNAKELHNQITDKKLMRDEEKNALPIAVLLYPYALANAEIDHENVSEASDARAFVSLAKKTSQIIRELAKEDILSMSAKEINELIY